MFRNTIVTSIAPPLIVQNRKGKVHEKTGRDCWGLSLCLSGQITYTMQGKDYISVPGYGVLLPKGASYRLHGDKEGLFPLVNFHCTGLSQDSIAVFPLSDPHACINDFELLRSLFLREEDHLKAYSVFYGLLNRMASAQHLEDTRLAPALDYIQDNLNDPNLSNQNIADYLGISEIYLRKLFLSRYQTTPKQYILKLRLHRAQELLQESTFSVTQVAELCGFASVYHFCRAFKGKLGITPSQYSKRDHLIHL